MPIICIEQNGLPREKQGGNLEMMKNAGKGNEEIWGQFLSNMNKSKFPPSLFQLPFNQQNVWLSKCLTQFYADFCYFDDS
jgi:hypothetical protein